MRVSRVLAMVIMGVTVTSAPLVAGAIPSPNGHLLDITRATTSSVIIKTSCRPDPPETAFVTTDTGTFLGSTPITCTGQRQTIVIPLSIPLTAGDKINLTATVSGDSGEINDFATVVVHAS
jgi:hypothetical protein